VLPRQNNRALSCSRIQILTELVNESTIVFVRADPKPDDQIAMLLRKSAIVITDSHGPDVSDKRLELHRWMERVTNPQLELFPSETLDVSW